MMTVIYIVAAVILLGLCIFVHELGHLLGGRMVGIKAKVFSIGYGKGIVKKKIGETTYQITPIPLGGYCLFYGEDPSEERQGKGYEFLSAHPVRRIVTVAMGPLFNLFFGILLFFIMNMVGYEKETNRIYIPEDYRSGKIVAPAFTAGLRTGDQIVAIDGSKVSDFTDIQSTVYFSDGEPLSITFVRDGDKKTSTVKPEKLGNASHFGIGVMPYGERILVAEVLDESAASRAGLRKLDEIATVDGNKFSKIHEFINYINARPGEKIDLTINRGGDTREITVVPEKKSIYSLRKEESEEPILNERMIQEHIRSGELRVEGVIVHSKMELDNLVERYRGKEVVVEHGDRRSKGELVSHQKGMIGIYPALNPEMILVKHGPGRALVQSFVEPYQFVVMNLRGFAMMFSGKLNVQENLSGPIRIAKIAGDVAYYRGIPAFVLLMAKISIILMIMNLLPIPVVDGGHLVFFTIEAIRGKPLSDRVMQWIQTVGVIFLISLGVFVIMNDIYRLFQ